MKDYLYRILGGWAEVELSGSRAERVLSLLALKNHRIWRVSRQGDRMFLTISLTALKDLRHIADEHHVHLRFGRRGGLPFRWTAASRRPFLFVGLISAFALVLYVTSHLWVIDVSVQGITPENRARLIETAELSGLRLGTSRRRVDLTRIRADMQKSLPDYSWIGIDIHGVVATIEAIPLARRPRLHLHPRMVADKGGRVTQMFVYMGSPEVAVGEDVTRGQTLIAGVVSGTLPDKGDAKPSEDSVVTPAEGEVFADVTYRATVYQSFKSRIQKPTGRRVTQYLFDVDNSWVVATPQLGLRPSHYQIQRQESPVRWAGVTWPLESIKIVYNEIQLRQVRYRPQQALKLAMRRATSDLTHRLPKGIRIVKKAERVLKKTTSGVTVQLVWTVNRNIATTPRAARKS